MAGPVERFHALWGEVADLGFASGLCTRDQETVMPRGGAAGRARLQATLAGLRHERLVAPELGEVVARCGEQAEPGSLLAAQVREARRQLARATRIPEALAPRAEAAAEGHEAWMAARAARDFARFRPALERLVALAREEAGLLAPPGAQIGRASWRERV